MNRVRCGGLYAGSFGHIVQVSPIGYWTYTQQYQSLSYEFCDHVQ